MKAYKFTMQPRELETFDQWVLVSDDLARYLETRDKGVGKVVEEIEWRVPGYVVTDWELGDINDIGYIQIHLTKLGKD